MLHTYLNYFSIVCFSLIASCLLLCVSLFVALFSYEEKKPKTYECGGLTFDDLREPFFVQFYLVSVLFILFDVEVTFMVPWCLCLYGLTFGGFISGLLFFVILIYGYIFEWKGGLFFF